MEAKESVGMEPKEFVSKAICLTLVFIIVVIGIISVLSTATGLSQLSQGDIFGLVFLAILLPTLLFAYYLRKLVLKAIGAN